jgi:hypothetical protein
VESLKEKLGNLIKEHPLFVIGWVVCFLMTFCAPVIIAAGAGWSKTIAAGIGMILFGIASCIMLFIAHEENIL